MATATSIILVAGTMTFTNEWYQTKKINWRVPVATLLLGAGFDGLSQLDSKVANMLAVMVLIGAGLTQFNGKSAAGTLASLFAAKPAAAPSKKTPAVQTV